MKGVQHVEELHARVEERKADVAERRQDMQGTLSGRAARETLQSLGDAFVAHVDRRGALAEAAAGS